MFECTMHGGVGNGDASYLVLVIDGINTLPVAPKLYVTQMGFVIYLHLLFV